MLLYRCSSERNNFISYTSFFPAKKFGYKQGIQFGRKRAAHRLKRPRLGHVLFEQHTTTNKKEHNTKYKKIRKEGTVAIHSASRGLQNWTRVWCHHHRIIALAAIVGVGSCSSWHGGHLVLLVLVALPPHEHREGSREVLWRWLGVVGVVGVVGVGSMFPHYMHHTSRGAWVAAIQGAHGDPIVGVARAVLSLRES